jgi:alkylhydroperoxidase family enzyme
MMPRGLLRRRDTELVILRVAHNCRSEYEWEHHRRLAERAGLDAASVSRVREGPDAPGWTPWQAALLRAADELHDERTLSDECWAELRPHVSDAEAIELLMLVGHYEMLAMTLNAMHVEPDDFGGHVPRVVERLAGGGARQ